MKKILLIVLGLPLLVMLLCGGAFLFQTVWAGVSVDQAYQATRVAKMQNLGTTRSLRIVPLFEEASARSDLELEHGVSYLIQTDQQSILMDVGMTPARLSHNMQALAVGSADFNTLFISHIHPDHVGGVNAWWHTSLEPGQPALDLRGKQAYVPNSLSIAGVDPVVVTNPRRIADGVASLGTLPFVDVFPVSLKSPQNLEQVLAVNVEGKGIVLIMGCGHPGVERIVARAQALFDEPVVGLVGGLHYEGLTREQTQPHLSFVSGLNPQLVAISPHDSSPEALQAFEDAFPQAYQNVAVGHSITFGRGAQEHTTSGAGKRE